MCIPERSQLCDNLLPSPQYDYQNMMSSHDRSKLEHKLLVFINIVCILTVKTFVITHLYNNYNVSDTRYCSVINALFSRLSLLVYDWAGH